MKVPQLEMWAMVVRSKRSEWINPSTIGRTRRQAWEKYLELWPPENHAELERRRKMGVLRLSRVTITAQRT